MPKRWTYIGIIKICCTTVCVTEIILDSQKEMHPVIRGPTHAAKLGRKISFEWTTV